MPSQMAAVLRYLRHVRGAPEGDAASDGPLLRRFVAQRDEGALLRGVGLAEAEGWLAEQAGQLSQPEKEFIRSSLALRDREKDLLAVKELVVP